MARHPGGIEQIMMGAGRDITQVFESYHSFSVYNILEKYYVGELVDNEMPVFPNQRYILCIAYSTFTFMIFFFAVIFIVYSRKELTNTSKTIILYVNNVIRT